MPLRPLLIAAILGLAACESEPVPVVFVGTDWRTSTGQLVTAPELAALREGCGPRPRPAMFDPDRPAATPAADNSAYRPGGIGLPGAPPSGIAAIGEAILPPVGRGQTVTLEPLDECLAAKGLVKSR